MNLPPYIQLHYHNHLNEGLIYPLTPVPTSENGLLGQLPAVPTTKSGWPWHEQTDPKIYNASKNWPKITVVTPSYNQDQFLEQTIRSVLLQNYPNLEYIIIDGGSTDTSTDILQKYSPWISYWRSEKDEGQGQAINMGFSIASGDYYAWINSDDYYLNEVFSIVVNRFLDTNAEFIYGYGYNYNVLRREFKLSKVLPLLDYFIKIPSLIQPSTFWSATIHKPIWEVLHCSLDYELWLRLVKGKKKHCIKNPLSVTNVHDAAKTHDPKLKVKWDEDQYKIWSLEGHGPVPEWKRIVFLNRIRIKLYKFFCKLF